MAPSKAPLWLPSGSIRSVITLSLVGTVIWLSLTGRTVPEVLATSLATAMGLYFSQRQGADHLASAARPADEKEA